MDRCHFWVIVVVGELMIPTAWEIGGVVDFGRVLAWQRRYRHLRDAPPFQSSDKSRSEADSLRQQDAALAVEEWFGEDRIQADLVDRYALHREYPSNQEYDILRA